MASISLSDCTVSLGVGPGLKRAKIVTPATADNGDTIDVSSLYDNGCHSSASSSSTAHTLCADKYGDKEVTLPGAATNEVHTIICEGD